ncbi:hypothetical protein NHX12_029834 [Muraenolepis orangiensis]|uniref:C2H2-type domain-containing protein n=1 Tax=Muraenolepis orangiensis TaxID=630683 RepID=A0A9Q0E6Z7_9TELE|nr:hypothetical protein NHX12_029834 [Muraenolepis orangiensis]
MLVKIRSSLTNSIKVELYSDDEPGHGPEEDRGDHGEDGGPEQGGDIGGGYRELNNAESGTTGATRLPNGKLKCDICGMICIGPNVLMVHKRSHTVSSPTVGKPYKCSYCGRSYKQQSTLEEHRERCHSYLQSLETQHPTSAQIPGPKHMRLNMADVPYELNAADEEMHPGEPEQPHFTGLSGDYAAAPGSGGGGGLVDHTMRPLCFPTARPLRVSELRPVMGSAHRAAPPHPGPRLDCTGAGPGAAGAGGREAAEGHEDVSAGRSRAPSPSNGCQDSTDTESVHDEPYGSTAPTLHLHNNNNNHNHHHLLHYNSNIPPPALLLPHRTRGRPSPGHAKDGEREEGGSHMGAQPAILAPPTPSSPTTPSSTSREAFRVVDGDGRAVRSFRCEHCRVLFLDHVMFTIHMGCHGFRQPFECNICGHRSQDRYEFSSHIVRGEHILE